MKNKLAHIKVGIIDDEEKIIENVKATMAMEGLYMTEEDVELLKIYKGDGNENDQKITQRANKEDDAG